MSVIGEEKVLGKEEKPGMMMRAEEEEEEEGLRDVEVGESIYLIITK